jgi:predicted alpha/beta hydrolase
VNPVTVTRRLVMGEKERPPRAVTYRESARHRATTRDGVELSLLRFSGDVRSNVPVLLTHGTLSNAQVCVRLASFLAEQGFDAWILEWRGHGESAAGDASPDFQYLAEFDVPAGLEAVRKLTGKPDVFLVGHSGGGLVFLMHLARQLESRTHIRGLVTLASQATEAGATWRDKARIAGFAVVNNVRGHLPGPALGLGPENEWRKVMNQWFRWNLSGRWLARDGFDYAKALRDVDIPMLCLAGAGDRFIAPVRGCRRLFDVVGSRDKEFVVCGKTAGFTEEYDHTRIIASRPAGQEVWPVILTWMRKRDAVRT